MDDERDLLRVFSQIQNGHRELAARILMGFVGPAGCEPLLACAEHLMVACDGGGLTLRPTNCPRDRVGKAAATGEASSASAPGNAARDIAGNVTVH